jgi:hypothetical protein
MTQPKYMSCPTVRLFRYSPTHIIQNRKYEYHTKQQNEAPRDWYRTVVYPNGVPPNSNFEARVYMEFSTAPIGGQTQSDGAWQLAYRAITIEKEGKVGNSPWCRPYVHESLTKHVTRLSGEKDNVIYSWLKKSQAPTCHGTQFFIPCAWYIMYYFPH